MIDDGEAQLRNWVVFEVGSARLGVPAATVNEFCAFDVLLPIPLAPPHLKGLLILRGRAIPVCDLAALFAIDRDETAHGDELRPQRLVILSGAGMQMAAVADRIVGTLALPAEQEQSPDAIRWGRVRDAATAQIEVAGGIAALLDVDRVFEGARVR